MFASDQFSKRWRQHFMRKAVNASLMSKDPTTKVGACLAASKTLSVDGYNGYPRFIEDKPMDRETKRLYTIHAEVNAILFAPFDTEGATLFTTHHPCHECAKIIVQAGIECVFYLGIPEQWELSCRKAWRIMGEGGVNVCKMKLEN